MSELIRPIRDMSRVQEHGRIRFGVQGPKFPKALDTFRFTSPDKEAIHQIAEVYGGEPRPWNERKARIQNQWEVITEADAIDVWLPPDAVSASYESWTAAGCQRRCDGVTVRLLDVEDPQPCICRAKNLRECKPKTRFNVVLPAIDFGGVWRGESGSWDALEEMQSMMDLIEAVRERGQPFLICRLILQDMKKTKQGETHRWKYPKLIPQDSMHNIIAGTTKFTALAQSADGTVRALVQGEDNEELIELPEREGEGTPVVIDDGEIIEAHVIDIKTFKTLADAIKAGHKRDELEKKDDGWHLK